VTRNRASAKAAGTRAESAVAAFFRTHVDDRIERRTKTGSKDRGDLSGVRHLGQRGCVEIKDVTRLALGEWIAEAETERGNDDALFGAVIHKKRGVSDVGSWYCTMTVRDLAALLTGDRPA
jgi:hypothetical protein